MQSDQRSLYCFDWDKLGDEIELNGFATSVEDYQMLSFDLVPCNYVHSYLGYEHDSIADGCIADREAQVEYLDNMKVRILMSQQNFLQDQYDDENIRNEVKFY